MPRRPRVDLSGFYHIIDRGVARTNVFLSDQDKEHFLKILCKACKTYKVNVHDYCLMDNHYHLLVEMTDENLSLFMRQINSNYAIYFNKKTKRSGHLWQGRYLSYYVVGYDYLFSLYRYIEHNPIKANICQKIGDYSFTLLATLLNPKLDVIDCAKHSQLKKDIDKEGFLQHLELSITEDELNTIKQEQKRKIDVEEHEMKLHKEKTLEEHFSNEERNQAIYNAIDDGYTQASIARYLSLTPSAIYRILTRNKDL
jgi:putative transposase